MAVRFHPLPAEVFPSEARPHILRLNRELGDLFGLEGVIRNPLSTRRSDETIARRNEVQVHVDRITPSVASVVSGVSTVVGLPALTLTTTNVTGTTTTALSVNSSIALFDATTPAAIGAGAGAVGSAAFSPRRDHQHQVNTGAPAFVFSTSGAVGTSTNLVRSDAQLAIFDATVPAALASAAYTVSAAFAARRDHVHLFPTTLRSSANASTLLLTDDATNQTLTGSLGNIIVNPSASAHILLSNSTALTNRVAVGSVFTTASKFQVRYSSTTNNTSALEFLADVNASSINVNAITGQMQTGTGSGVGTGSTLRAFFPNIQIRGVNKTVGLVVGTLVNLSFSSDDATSVLTNYYGTALNTPTRGTSATITNFYGHRVESMPSWVGSTNQYDFYSVDAKSFFGGNIEQNDSIKWVGGTGKDAEIYYDGTSLILDPDVVGAGRVLIGATGDDDMRLNSIEIDGALNHDGTTVGFYGVAPATRSAAYILANVTTDRSYDANATTLDEIADALGTLIADLQLTGIIG